MIFDASPRLDGTPKRNREGDFAFLNRSARPEIEAVRQFLERVLEAYPESEADELISRIRSGNNTNFNSAVFELLLYGTLTEIGFHLYPHPALENGSTSRPDFHVTAPDGSEFYLEAVLASENNGADPAAQARMGAVIDALTQASHPNFRISVESDGVPETQPSGKKLRAAAIAWLNTLDPDQVQEVVDKEGLDAAPTTQWVHEDWQVTLRAIPVRPDRRGRTKSLVGALDGIGGFIDAWTPIRNAIKYKGSKYGTLTKPLLVAINFDSFHLDKIDEMQALYGQEQYIFTAGDANEPRFERAQNGAWYGKNGPSSTRVSGAWIFNDLNPYTVALRRNTLYLNPWAAIPLPETMKQFPHAIPDSGKMVWLDGISLREIFNLSETWPE